MKKWGFFTFLLLLGFTGWTVYQELSKKSGDNSPGGRKAALPVETAAVRKEDIYDVGSFTGTLFPRSQFVVAPKTGGRLEDLLVNIGDHLQPGQVIAVLDDDEYVQQLDQAKAELEVARANLQESRSSLGLAKREFERAQALRQKKITSESELDSAEAQFQVQEAKYKVALAQIAQKQAALKAAEVRLSYTKIYATWENEGSRVVGQRFVDEGAMLAPNDSIVSILDIRSLIAVVHVIERDYTKVHVGQTAVVTTDAFPGKVFVGEVIRIAPLIKETSRQSRVEIKIPNDGETLKPGMFVRVRIEFSRQQDTPVIPVAAVCKRDGKQGVFLVDERLMVARFVPVVLGIVDGDRAQVISPPLSGSVVTLGQHLLSDGSSIVVPSPRDQKPPSKVTEETTGDAQQRPGGSSL